MEPPDALTVADFPALCRFCLTRASRKGPHHNQIFLQNGLYKRYARDSNETLADMIENCLGMKINLDDDLPINICDSCETTLMAYNDFRHRCHRSVQTLFVIRYRDPSACQSTAASVVDPIRSVAPPLPPLPLPSSSPPPLTNIETGEPIVERIILTIGAVPPLANDVHNGAEEDVNHIEYAMYDVDDHGRLENIVDDDTDETERLDAAATTTMTTTTTTTTTQSTSTGECDDNVTADVLDDMNAEMLDDSLLVDVPFVNWGDEIPPMPLIDQQLVETSTLVSYLESITGIEIVGTAEASTEVAPIESISNVVAAAAAASSEPPSSSSTSADTQPHQERTNSYHSRRKRRHVIHQDDLRLSKKPPVLCGVCGLLVRQLRFHMKIKHPDLKRFSCSLCMRSYRCQVDLDVHTARKHPAETPPLSEVASSDDVRSGSGRSRNPHRWECNVRKQRRQSGRSYVGHNGVVRPERCVRSRCLASCSHRCADMFDADSRQAVHTAFWSLPDCEKDKFYARYVQRIRPLRVRTKASASRKAFTYRYYFDRTTGDRRQVCQLFFTTTLDISKHRVYTYFKGFAAGGETEADGEEI